MTRIANHVFDVIHFSYTNRQQTFPVKYSPTVDSQYGTDIRTFLRSTKDFQRRSNRDFLIEKYHWDYLGAIVIAGAGP